LVQIVALGSPTRNDTFLGLFGTPVLLWRVLHSVGYMEPPHYFWTQEYVEGQLWYEVQMTIPARAQAPQCRNGGLSPRGRALGKVPKRWLLRF
jgi:hypothetical protein